MGLQDMLEGFLKLSTATGSYQLQKTSTRKVIWAILDTY